MKALWFRYFQISPKFWSQNVHRFEGVVDWSSFGNGGVDDDGEVSVGEDTFTFVLSSPRIHADKPSLRYGFL